MRLSPNTEHNPEVGFWFRVCNSCFTSKAGYLYTPPMTRDHSKSFCSTRSKMIEAREFKRITLEARLKNIVALHHENNERGNSNGRRVGRKASFMDLFDRGLEKGERSFVRWDEDAHVKTCSLCKYVEIRFSSFRDRASKVFSV